MQNAVKKSGQKITQSVFFRFLGVFFIACINDRHTKKERKNAKILQKPIDKKNDSDTILPYSEKRGINKMQVGSIKRGTMNITMRLPNETARQLDELCQAYNCKRSDFVISQIQAQYDKLQGSPVLKQMLDSMNALTAKLKEQAQNENESSHTDGKA